MNVIIFPATGTLKVHRQLVKHPEVTGNVRNIKEQLKERSVVIKNCKDSKLTLLVQ